MCGIFCYYNSHGILYNNILHIVLAGLKTLEYRGYDSAGIYIPAVENGQDILLKSVGNVDQLRSSAFETRVADTPRTIAMGHTRWATHGKPSARNTHPHSSPDNNFVVVHNGIITNYIFLKMYLHDFHYHCLSETDTEVIPLLFHKFSIEHPSDTFPELTQRVISVLEGTFAITIVSKKYPNEMIAVRKESPMILGECGDGGYVLSSDISGIASFGRTTNKAVFLKNNDVVHLTINGCAIFNSGRRVERETDSIDSVYQETTKGSYSHFMEKEIFEQPYSISMTFKNRIVNSRHILIPELIPHLLRIQNAKRILLVACGSSWHACLTVRNYYEKIFSDKIIQIENSCNLLDRYDFFLSCHDIAIFLSQSGETSDTLFCLRHMKNRCPSILTCAITNMHHSSLARECDVVVYNNIGNEIGVASTKSYTSQILLLVLLALQFCNDQEHIDQMIQEIEHLPSLMSQSLTVKIPDSVMDEFMNCGNVLIIGRNEHYAIALETALKLKEISYIHSEGLLADELKHGPLAMIDPSVVIFVIASNDPRMHSTIQQLRARNARLVILQPSESDNDTHALSVKIMNPLINGVLRAIVDIVPCQLLAYSIALRKEINVDQPRHLAKSVTVSD